MVRSVTSFVFKKNHPASCFRLPTSKGAPLYSERAITIAGSFHPARCTRLILAHRKTRKALKVRAQRAQSVLFDDCINCFQEPAAGTTNHISLFFKNQTHFRVLPCFPWFRIGLLPSRSDACLPQAGFARHAGQTKKRAGFHRPALYTQAVLTKLNLVKLN
jgi:hypothetical protein